MRTFKLSYTLASIYLATLSTSYAAAFQLYKLGTPIIASAGVGQAALAADASTAYFNPAGMTALPRSADLPMDRQIRVGAGVLYAATKQIQFGAAYEYINMGSAAISNTSSVGTLAGDYS
jgi:long-subunit fatty acid transport protein